MIRTSKHPVDVLESLSRYDTPTICNAIELFDVRPRTAGYMDGTIHCCFPQLPPMVGYAITAKFMASDSSTPGAYQAIMRQIEHAAALGAPAVVVFEDLDRPSVAATFGEVMCSTYQACGIVGLITSGAGRDLDQVEALGFAAFVGSAICSHGYCNIVETDTPVRVGGLTVAPGDLLHGDRNGVTTIPHEIASELPQACVRVTEAEKVVFDYVQGGSVTCQGLAEAWKEWNTLRKELAASFGRKPA